MHIPKTESTRVECKATFNNDAIVSLVAFANADGGDVYIGIRDDGKVIGVTLAKESETEWVNEVKTKTAPSIVPEAHRIEFSNPGGLPVGLTVDELLSDNYRSLPRNPRVAELFRYSGLIEQYGSGIRRIVEECSAHGGVEAIFSDHSSWFEVVLRKRTGTGLMLPERLPESKGKIFTLLSENPFVTVPELMKVLSVSHTAVVKNIAWLKAHGYVRRVGGARGGHWEVARQ
jgi:predicted HTH transcriptional regulator